MIPRSCLNCTFGQALKCHSMMEMATRILIRNIKFTDGLAFMEVKAASCDAYNGTVPKAPRRLKGQLAFNFMD